MISSHNILVNTFGFSYCVSDTYLLGGRANNLLSSVEHTTPPVMAIKSSNYLLVMILLMFGSVYIFTIADETDKCYLRFEILYLNHTFYNFISDTSLSDRMANLQGWETQPLIFFLLCNIILLPI